MKAEGPIGIFDSGVGGVSIWIELRNQMPNEHTLYLADSVNAPYGKKSKEEIIALCEKNTEFWLNEGAKIIVVACNTATTNAISHLRAKYDVPFIGIEPAIKPAAFKTKTKSIGVLATAGTLSSELFAKTSDAFTSDIKVTEVIGEGLVELIENGQIESPEMTSLLQKYVDQLLDAGVDYIVLGCSHYPFLSPQLQQMLPEHVNVIDSGVAVARQTERVLIEHELLFNHKKPANRFLTNRNIEVLSSVLKFAQWPLDINKAEF